MTSLWLAAIFYVPAIFLTANLLIAIGYRINNGNRMADFAFAMDDIFTTPVGRVVLRVMGFFANYVIMFLQLWVTFLHGAIAVFIRVRR